MLVNMETIMKTMVITIILLHHHATAWEQYDKCDLDFEKVGCFDDLKDDRALSSELLNERDPTNPKYDGHRIDWGSFTGYISGLACRCAAKSREEGYEYFGLQYYGECWSGNGDHKKHGKALPSKCIPDYNQQCVDENEDVCVGKGSVNYVYKLKPSSHAGGCSTLRTDCTASGILPVTLKCNSPGKWFTVHKATYSGGSSSDSGNLLQQCNASRKQDGAGGVTCVISNVPGAVAGNYNVDIVFQCWSK